MRRWLPLLITALLLGSLAFIVDPSRVRAQIAGISPSFLALAVFATALNLLISSLRYQAILRAMATRQSSLISVLQINLLSVFAAHFLPVAAAADGLRVALATRRFGLQFIGAFESVVSDRILAVTGLCACAILALPLQAALGATAAVLGLQLVGTSALLGVSALVVWSASRGIVPTWAWARKLALLSQGVARHFACRSALQTQALLAIASALMFAATLWVLAAGIGVRLSVVEALAFGPMIYLSQVVPFVYFGFGARETVAVLFLSGVGSLNADSAFSVGFAVGVCNMLVCLPAPLLAAHLIREWRREGRD